MVSDSPDSDGAYTIVWNQAPTTPPSITVPDEVRSGKTAEISWTASVDPEGGAITYELERSINSGAWTNIYTGSATSSYVKGYTVTADYTGTVSRIALNRVRYVAIFEGTPIQPAEPANVPSAASAFRWSYVLIPLGIVAAAGAGVGGALLVKHRKENVDEEETAE